MKNLLILVMIVLFINVGSAQTPMEVAGTANKIASSSGNWSSTTTWGGTLPTNDARILIPNGITVTVDGIIEQEFKSVRIADGGKLQFAANVNTELRTEYLYSGMMGSLEIGTSTDKIETEVTARLVFAERGGTTDADDPNRFAPGAVLMGPTKMHGANKTSWLTLQTHPIAGATQFEFNSAPTGWQIGDQIVVAGTDPITNASTVRSPVSTAEFERDEVVTITAVSGSTVTFTPELQWDHQAPMQAPDLDVHVANLSRNIVITSENPSVTSISGEFRKPRGHIMFMHNMDVDLRFVEANNLGRTDKNIILDHWDFEDLDAKQNTGKAVPNGNRNPRGRYSFHFHQGNLNTSVFPATANLPLPTPVQVEGCVVNNDPGWGYVNHSSHVDFIRNVSYNVVGGAFNTEAGNETGSFIENIAIRTVNPANPIMVAPRPRSLSDEAPTSSLVDLRERRQDFAWQGDAFWFHGTGVTVSGNVVASCTGHAFVYWTEGLLEKNLGFTRGSIDVHVPASEFPSLNAELKAWKNTNPNFVLDVWYLKARPFTNNTAYNFARGVQTYYTHTEFHRKTDPSETDPNVWMNDLPPNYKDQLDLTFDGTILWNIGRVGFESNHTTNITIQNSRVIGYNARTGFENYGSHPAPVEYLSFEPEVIGMDLDYYYNTHRWTLNNNTVEGFSGNSIGIALPISAQVTMNGGTFDNAGTDIQISSPAENFQNEDGEGFGIGMQTVRPTRSKILLQGDITFANPNNNIVMNAQILYDEIPQKGFDLISGEKEDPLYFFAPMDIRLNFGPFTNQRAYFNEQDGGFIPINNTNRCAFTESEACVNSRYVNKTNTELLNQFGNSYLGSITPATAETHPMVVGGKVGGVVLSVNDFDMESDLNVFPNPSKDGVFEINSPAGEKIEKLGVYNISGQLIAEPKIMESKTIDLRNLPSGIYLLKISVKNKTGLYRKKIMIE